MKNTHLRDDRLRVACAYALFTGEDVYATHYLFNSIIGKYSRYDKDSSEIEKELGVHLAAIHEKVQA